MPNIGEFTHLAGVLLWEGGKYLIVLVLLVVSLRLWRIVFRQSPGKKWASLGLACAFSAACAGATWVSMQHSLGRLYYYYGVKTFRTGDTVSAGLLFETSAKHWKFADAVGRRGICLLLTDRNSEGERLLEQAKSMRQGEISTFEAFYAGFAYFFHNKSQQAISFLQASTIDPDYKWAAVKLLATIKVDEGKPQEARELLAPYDKFGVADCEHAYVVASLDLIDGKQSEARALLDRFPTNNLTGFWKAKFEKLRLKAQGKTT